MSWSLSEEVFAEVNEIHRGTCVAMIQASLTHRLGHVLIISFKRAHVLRAHKQGGVTFC